MNFDEDPLDLFEDDGDGVIETILLLDEEDRKPVTEKTGCAVLIFAVGASIGLGCWSFLDYLA